jgi:hypothetical protein
MTIVGDKLEVSKELKHAVITRGSFPLGAAASFGFWAGLDAPVSFLSIGPKSIGLGIMSE